VTVDADGDGLPDPKDTTTSVPGDLRTGVTQLLAAFPNPMIGAAQVPLLLAGRADGGKDELGTDQKGRTQRQTMALKNVRYRLTAKIVPKPEFTADFSKMNAQFLRRAKAGKCFQQPYFGCREFPAFFEYLQDPAARLADPAPFDQGLGFMLYDVFDLSREVFKEGDQPFISLFDARVVKGTLEVPPFESAAVKKPRRA